MSNNIVKSEGTFEGIVKITIVDKEGNISYDGKPYKNLLTDYGFDYVLGTNNSWQTATVYCGVGTSSTTPQFTDVAAGAQVGTRTASTSSISNTNTGSPNYIESYVRTFAFTQGQVTGNLAEVVFCSASTGSNASSRSLIKDGGGNPTTLTVLATDTLYITYELRYVPNLTDTSGTHTISGVGYAYVQRVRGVGATNGSPLTRAPLSTTNAPDTYETNTLAALGVAPSGTTLGASSAALQTYSAGTKYRDIIMTSLPAANVHATGIGIISWGGASPGNSFSGFYTAYTPVKIPKLNTQTLTLTYRLAMARV